MVRTANHTELTMPQDINRQIAESLDATPDLLPFLPELLADWTSSP